MLWVFDRRPVIDWNSITVNTTVSTLSVVMKAFLMFATAECIGQWKWILFCRKKRRLLEFEHIDSASRGPLGSLSAWRWDTPYVSPSSIKGVANSIDICCGWGLPSRPLL